MAPRAPPVPTPMYTEYVCSKVDYYYQRLLCVDKTILSGKSCFVQFVSVCRLCREPTCANPIATAMAPLTL